MFFYPKWGHIHKNTTNPTPNYQYYKQAIQYDIHRSK